MDGTMPETQTLEGLWPELRAASEQAREQLLAELAAAWGELDATVGAVLQRPAVDAPEPATLASWREFLAGAGRELLVEPAGELKRRRAAARALAAIGNYQQSISELSRRLPATRAADDAAAAKVVGGRRPLRWPGGSGRGARPLRAAVERHFQREIDGDTDWQGQLLLAMARAMLLAMAPWQQARRAALLRFSGDEGEAATAARQERQWERLQQQGAMALRRARAGQDEGSRRLARAVLRAQAAPAAGTRHHQRAMQFWSRQQRAVSAQVDLEVAFGGLAQALTEAGEAALGELEREQGQLNAELEAVAGWLAAGTEGEFPPPAAKLASAKDRLAGWRRAAETAVRAQLPARVEAIEPRWRRPPRRSPWRVLEPRAAVLEGLSRFGAPRLLEGLSGVEEAQAGIIRDIERAREVVAYGREEARADPSGGAAVERESIANARSLVRFERQQATGAHREEVEARLVAGTAAALRYAHLTIEQRRLGAWKQLARQSGSALALEAARLAVRQSSAAGRKFQAWVNRETHRGLRAIGWEAPLATAPQPVEARAVFAVPAAPAREMPMIYRRLFRLAPVEEPRFLVGREAELAALAQARALWQAQRAVAACVVGARGSGKTSLLNCAIALEYADLTPMRAQFNRRMTGAGEMRAFLRELLGTQADGVEQELRRERRIVILEELEWTFLRRMGGFGAVEELLGIISATPETLWIVSLNESCYRYLDAAVGLGRYFSHRINAMAVAETDLRNAILMRHHLSGLRLQYPAPRQMDPQLSRMRRALGLERTPEEMFFDRLYEQTEGVFRSAFERWQGYVERVEGGVLYLREPLEADHEPLIAELNRHDGFALQAMLQHGSLTVEDLAAVFECGVEESRQRLERLLGLELLEPEPSVAARHGDSGAPPPRLPAVGSPLRAPNGATGVSFRVRPEAGHVVRLALHRRNLG